MHWEEMVKQVVNKSRLSVQILTKVLNIIRAKRFFFQPEVETCFQTAASREDIEDVLIFDLEEFLVFTLEAFQEEKNIETQLE